MTRPIKRREDEPSRTGHRLVRPGRDTSGAGAPLDLYEITTAAQYDSSVNEWYYGGKPVVFNTTTELYTVQASASEEVLWLPTAMREDVTTLPGASDDAAEAQITCYVGQRVYATVRDTRREIVSPPLDEWRGELKTALVPGGSATAYLRTWTGAAWETNTDIEFLVWDRDGKFRGRAKGTYDGFYILAKYWPDSNRWEIKECQGYAEEIEVTLAENMGNTFAGRASCAVNDFYRGQNPDPGAAGILVDDPQGHFAHALSGALGKATYDREDDRYILRQCQTKAKRIRFTMTQDLQAGTPKYATATVNQYYDGQDPGASTTVYDDAGLYGDAKDTASGYAFLDEHNNQYIIDDCNQLAFIGRCNVNEGSNVAWGVTPFNVDGVDVAGPPNHSQTPTFTSVTNLFGWPCNDDQEIFWFREGSTYYAIPKPPLEQIDVPTDLRYEAGTDHQLQWKKTQHVLVWQADDQDATWSSWHQLSLDKFVIDSQVTAGNAYQHKETTVYCMEAPVDDGTFDNTWVTGSTC